jgi:hypothetical protein
MAVMRTGFGMQLLIIQVSAWCMRANPSFPPMRSPRWRRAVNAGSGISTVSQAFAVSANSAGPPAEPARLGLAAPATRPRTVERLDRAEVECLIADAYRDGSQWGLMIKTPFLSGARVDEFVYIRVEDLHLDDDPPRIHLTHARSRPSATCRSCRRRRRICTPL